MFTRKLINLSHFAINRLTHTIEKPKLVTFEYIIDRINSSQNSATECFKTNNDIFNHIKDEYITEEMCLILLDDNHPITRFRSQFQTEKIALRTMENSPHSFQYIRPDLQTDELCHLALKHDISLFQYIRQDLRTEELCYMASCHYGLGSQNHNVYKLTEEQFTEKIFKQIMKYF
jgi:hypothetical protein